MFPRRGDVFECPVCGFRARVTDSPHVSPLMVKEKPECVCGSPMDLLQSGSESTDPGHDNKLISPPIAVRVEHNDEVTLI